MNLPCEKLPRPVGKCPCLITQQGTGKWGKYGRINARSFTNKEDGTHSIISPKMELWISTRWTRSWLIYLRPYANMDPELLECFRLLHRFYWRLLSASLTKLYVHSFLFSACYLFAPGI